MEDISIHERGIIYLAISNLIKDCIESLEGIEKLPKEANNNEDSEMLNYILEEAIKLEEKYRPLETELPIDRPNWKAL